jgi:hypothetical protein
MAAVIAEIKEWKTLSTSSNLMDLSTITKELKTMLIKSKDQFFALIELVRNHFARNE